MIFHYVRAMGLTANRRRPRKRPCAREPSAVSSSYRKAGSLGSPSLSSNLIFPSRSFALVLKGAVHLISRGLKGMCCHLPLWVRDKLGDVVDRAQQPGCDEVFPPAPDLHGAWILDVDEFVHVYRRGTIFATWEVMFRDECDDGLLEGLGVRLSPLGSG